MSLNLKAASLARHVISVFSRRGLTLVTAESLTGGLIGATLTSVPGASAVYWGGAITYATAMKTSALGVRIETIDESSVISSQTVTEMALGAQQNTGADFALAVTGVAGPDPQDGHCPGEVWVGLACPRDGIIGKVISRGFTFSGNRSQIRWQTVVEALDMLLEEVLDEVA
ncbi:MAG: CinA family protein [Propionibacteriaceae bacterium]|jgi:nicotinamide-nucleotide amidase|nr:CinA family protein [Propionibacteriaceae bacterium]